MFRQEWSTPWAFDPLSPRVREFLDLLDAHKQKVRAEQEANKLTRLLLNDKTLHTKLTLTDGSTLEIITSSPDAARIQVVISQDQKPPFHVLSSAYWDIRTKELLEYEEFDTEGLRVGSVRNKLRPLKNEPLYKAINDREGRREIIDLDTGLQRRVYAQVASMFALARETLALEKTTNKLLYHR